MLHPNKGIILTVHEHACTMLRFTPEKPVDIRHIQDHRALSNYLKQAPDHPLYVLLDPIYQSIQHFPLPQLTPWNQYLYLRRLRNEYGVNEQFCGLLPICKDHRTVGVVTSGKTAGIMAWIRTLEKIHHPIIGISFQSIEALHWLKQITPKWNQDWHILCCQDSDKNMEQLVFYNGQLWLSRKTSERNVQDDLQATLSHIRKIPKVTVKRIAVHMLSLDIPDNKSAKILGPQTTCAYIDDHKYPEFNASNFPNQMCRIDAIIGNSLWQSKTLNANLNIPELSNQKRLYILPRLMMSLGSSLTTVILLSVGWMQYHEANAQQTHPKLIPQNPVSIILNNETLQKLNLRTINPSTQLKKIAPIISKTGLMQILWENTVCGGQIKLLIDAENSKDSRKFQQFQKQLTQITPSTFLYNSQEDGTYCVEIRDLKI